MTWKDLKHPQAGGAERINEEIAKRMARDGHEVILLTTKFSDCEIEEQIDGYKVIRLGNRYMVYWQTYRYYKQHMVGWADLVIDEMNTIPFFCKFYVREKNILLAYQLCREIWFYQMRFPLSMIGYLLEPIYLWLLRDRYVITESKSTKQDMLRYGFFSNRISIIRVGITAQPLSNLTEVKKFTRPTVLSFGSVRAMKRTLDQIESFEIAKEKIPDLQLKIAGSTSDGYGKKVLRRIAASKYTRDIEYLGCVGEKKKAELMQKSHFILVTSVKEGWGLIVTEANSQGTPAVVYDVDGLRDSVRDLESGLISKENSPRGLADVLVRGLRNADAYAQMREKAWLWSRELTLEDCYLDFMRKAF
uniref:glycosyltransferase family 4 protein n=1 Tax=Flavobacterium sp. TaxID=239 RepID=UPI004047601C